MDEGKHEIDGVNNEINRANHVKQSSILQSSKAKYSLFESTTLIQSSLVMKELLGWSLDGALNPWSCFLFIFLKLQRSCSYFYTAAIKR